MSDELSILDFSVNRAIRYHAKLRRFNGAVHRTLTVVILTAGTTAFADLLSAVEPTSDQAFALWATLVVALASIFEFVVGFAERARLHHDLYRRFSDLSAALACTPMTTDSRAICELKARRLAIEVDEPTPNNVLNVICHNEEVEARGLDSSNIRRIYWFQRLFCYVADLPPNHFPPVKKKNSVLAQDVSRAIWQQSDTPNSVAK